MTPIPMRLSLASPERASGGRRRFSPAATVLALLASSLSSCVLGNFDFDTISESPGSARHAALLSAAEEKGEDGLGSFVYVPLLYFDANVFANAGEDELPEGHMEADLEAFLPLLAFLDGRVTRYDEEGEVYEQTEVNSYFWGLFFTRREQVATPYGTRHRTSHRLLWFIPVGGSSKYVDDVESPGGAAPDPGGASELGES